MRQGTEGTFRGLLLGGLLAGLVVTVSGFLLAHLFLIEEFSAASERFGLPTAPPSIFFVHVASRLAMGLVATALYALLRGVFTGTVQAGAAAGAFVWLLAYVFFALGILGFGLFPWRFYLVWVLWGAGEAVAATLAGAWVYERFAILVADPGNGPDTVS